MGRRLRAAQTARERMSACMLARGLPAVIELVTSGATTGITGIDGHDAGTGPRNCTTP